MLPAPAQGALAVECRAADLDTAWYADGCAGAGLPDSPGRRDRRTQPAGHAGGRLHRAGRRVRRPSRDGVLTLTGAVIAVDGTSQVRRRAHRLGPARRPSSAGIWRWTCCPGAPRSCSGRRDESTPTSAMDRFAPVWRVLVPRTPDRAGALVDACCGCRAPRPLRCR